MSAEGPDGTRRKSLPWLEGKLEPVDLEDVLEQGETTVKDVGGLPETTTTV